MHKKEIHDIQRKLKVFRYAKEVGNVYKACRHYGISRETYYKWQRRYKKDGEKGLINSKPCPQNPKLRVPEAIEEQVLYLRQNYHFGAERIAWYLMRYHDVKISAGGVRCVLN